MIDKILEFVMQHLSEILLAMLTALLAFALREARRVVHLLADFARQFAAEAKKTPSPGDDVAAALLLAFATALETSVDKALPPKK